MPLLEQHWHLPLSVHDSATEQAQLLLDHLSKSSELM
jgi:hypothetical protein